MKLKIKNETDIIYVDDNIADEIAILNDKGYKTMACCGGHIERECYIINVVFDIDYKLDAPKGFKWYAKGIGLEFYIHKNRYKPLDKYNKAMVEFKQWVKDLPKNNLK